MSSSPHPLFDSEWYLQQNPDVAAAGINPLQHYMAHGWREGRDPNPLFDTSFYLEQNPDVAEAGENPLVHYCEYGWRERRDPHPDFNTSWYLDNNSDVASSETNPLLHYALYGRTEGRQIRPQATSALLGRLPDGITRLLNMFHEPAFGSVLQRLYQITAEYGHRTIPHKDATRDRTISQLTSETASMSRRCNRNTTPSASIIIPVHNNFVYTLCCIHAILATSPKESFEILIADDCSTDATSDVFSDVGGLVKLVRQPENVGFLKNCNSAAMQARGDVLVFLNNDTFVLTGWLDELVGTIKRDSNIGLVGSKLINADGTLQEAGGIVWNDASAWNFGRGDDACAPQYNYMKAADYVSGASIAVPKSTWDELDGFDRRYAPAYYEDTDLAFRVRQIGKETVYHPFSAAIHHEGVSHGQDLNTGVKAYQEHNRATFLNRWSDVLKIKHYANGDNVLFARDRSGSRPRILIVDHYVPQPDRDAGSRSMMHYIELFVRSGFHVTFWPHNRHFDRLYAMNLQRLGVETIYGWNDFWPEFSDWIKENGHTLNYAFLSRPSVAIDFLPPLRSHSNAKILFYGHDIHFRRLQLEFELKKDESLLAQIREWESLERHVWPQCDFVYYPSKEEERFVSRELPQTKARTLPLYLYDKDVLAERMEAIKGRDTSTSNRILFVGGFRHSPNVDAAIWFCNEIWPDILRQIPDAHLTIAGSSPTSEIQALANNNITVTGYVTDEALNELYFETDIVIVPLRYGGGMKGKVIEALSYGAQLITTDIGVQGLSALPSSVKIHNDIINFARGTIDALHNKRNRNEDAVATITYVTDHFSNHAARQALGDAAPEILSSSRLRGPNGTVSAI